MNNILTKLIVWLSAKQKCTCCEHYWDIEKDGDMYDTSWCKGCVRECTGDNYDN